MRMHSAPVYFCWLTFDVRGRCNDEAAEESLKRSFGAVLLDGIVSHLHPQRAVKSASQGK